MNDRHYKNYLLGILLVIQAFNLAERWTLGLVLQDIKLDLSLSDTELGFLSGLAFAVFYAVMGVPIARWADRGNRVTIIAVTLAVWSVTVALCGAARNFAQLLLARIAVAVGEAGCIPPAHSLIGTYFPRAQRPRAMARYMLGGPLSVVIGYFVAGWLNQLYGWRMTFLALGLPGLVLAALAWTTLREPRRDRRVTQVESGDPEPENQSAHDQLGLREVCGVLWRNVTFRHLLLGFSVIYFFGAGISTWQPAFLIRSYGLGTGELGTWFAVIYGLGGLVGTLCGGEWADRQASRDEALQLRAIGFVYAGFGIVSTCIYLSPNLHVAFGFIALGAFGVNFAIGPVFSTLQTLVPGHMRAVSIALIYLFANLIGMGLGPLLAGVLSDAFATRFGDESLRYTLLALCPGYFWGAWHYFKGGETIARDLRRMRHGPETADEPDHSLQRSESSRA
jgi:predicted MFS family arabinose efflux permease